MFKILDNYNNNLYKLFCQFLFVIIILQNHTIANESNLSISYQWTPQYYGKIKGEKKLLYSRSFSRSQLRFVDIDGDGDKDLFIGKEDGRMAFLENQSEFSNTHFKLITEDFLVIHERLDEKGNPSLHKTVLDVGKNAAPEFVDIDNDNDYDLFVGSSDGHIFHYENIGNQLKPIFSRKTPIYMGLKFVGNSVPLFSDLNGDNAYDLLVGTRSGKINVFYNSGSIQDALFCPEFEIKNPPNISCKFQPEIAADIGPLIDASPDLIDWDQDKDLDLVVGKSNGKLNFYLNKGDRYAPEWELKSRNFQFIDTGGNVFPKFHDLDEDNFPELFLGTTSSMVIYYKNKEILRDKLSKINTIQLEKLNVSTSIENTLSLACDQLGGLPDCLTILSAALDVPKEIKISEIKEFLPYILRPELSFNSNILDDAHSSGITKDSLEVKNKSENNIKKHKTNHINSKNILTSNKLWLVSRNFLNIGKLGRNVLFSSISSGDWNEDGRLDILLGSKSGEIFAFENRATNGFDWYPINFPALKKNNREFSYPVLADIDGDKDLDIISGNKEGKLEWILNSGTQKKPNWEVYDLNLSQIDVGNFSTPLLKDMDSDNDLDILTGNGKGLLIYYENNGNNNSPKYVLKSTRITGIRMKANSAPSFWRWNKDKYPDLFVGNREGIIKLITHLPPEKSQIFRGWTLESEEWQKIKSIGHSTPHFADFDGDNKTDFMMGDKQGNLIFWKNGGVKILENIDENNTLILKENSLEDESKIKKDSNNVPELDESRTAQENQLDESFDPKFELITDKYGDLEFGQRAFPAFMDIDGDQILDLIVGNKAGELRYYRQENSFSSTKWILETNNFLDYKGEKNSAPVFADLDGDNDLDLLVGNQKGSIKFWENKGSSDFPDFEYNPTPLIGVTGGRNSVPAVIDLNLDGFNDIIVGNLLGQLYKYIHLKKNNKTRFRLERRKYLNLDVGLGAVPKIADINNDKQPELIIGSDSGKIRSLKIISAKNSPLRWEPIADYFNDIKLPVGGNPVFVDLDSDGDLDLIVGSERGTLYYFRNTGN